MDEKSELGLEVGRVGVGWGELSLGRMSRLFRPAELSLAGARGLFRWGELGLGCASWGLVWGELGLARARFGVGRRLRPASAARVEAALDPFAVEQRPSHRVAQGVLFRQ